MNLAGVLSESGVLEKFEQLPGDERAHFEKWVEAAKDDTHREIRISMLIQTLKEK